MEEQERWQEAGLTVVAEHKCFGGRQLVFRHDSKVIGLPMEVAVYLPPHAAEGPVPAVTFLSGLTCTWENFVTKAGAQREAANLGLALIAPDTSPRGAGIAGEDEAYDFGTGAGFYLDATEAPWDRHYRMYSYVTSELPDLLARGLPVDPARQSITGHSMGGHGALVAALANPDRYRAVSAFAPIVTPMDVPWGQKAFTGYLGEDRERWAAYDATRLLATTGWNSDILIDQGTADTFLDSQLQPQRFEAAALAREIPVQLRFQAGYDHSYYFIASFMDEHLAFHHDRLIA
ncbi:S-formylglutathione hydrolase [Yunchengibacter salinarum]|uniref:S-formylglutathione hydrolase n=1 Tax=Yunchengibacter salinarum TaxID=3133399 RepID=UPI0035B5EFDA